MQRWEVELLLFMLQKAIKEEIKLCAVEEIRPLARGL